MTIISDQDGLQHRLRIRETADRYFNCADLPDAGGVAACFAREGIFRSATQAEMRLVGRPEIERGFKSFQKWGRSCHMIASMNVTLHGETATGALLGVSYVAGAAREGDPMRVRGLRYVDRWIIEDGCWVLAERVHEAVWQFETTQMHLRLPEISD
jgi:hypothetical protein